MTVVSFIVSFSLHGPLTRYVKRRVAHVSGMTGTKPPSGYTSNCVNKANLLFKRIWMLCYRSFRTACEFYGLLDTSTYFKLDESRPVSVTSTLLRVTSCLEFSQNLCLKFVNTVTKQKNRVGSMCPADHCTISSKDPVWCRECSTFAAAVWNYRIFRT